MRWSQTGREMTMATAKAKGKTAPEMISTQFVMLLKKEGVHVAHFATNLDGEEPSAFKDAYMTHDYFESLGKPDKITVTIVPGDMLND